MKRYMLFTIAVLFVLASSLSYAQSFESYDIQFHIAFNNVVVKEIMVLENPVSGNMAFDLPKDRKGLSVSIDGESINPQVYEDSLNLDLSSAKTIEISYVTKDLLERNDFIASFKAPYNISSLHIELFLPENAILVEPLSDADIGSGSVYPKPSEAATDGQSITLKWDFSSVLKGEEKSFFVRYKKQASFSYIIFSVIIVILLVIGFAAFIIRRPKVKESPQTKEVEKVVEKIVEKPAEQEKGFEKHLKEDEEQVVNILKQREGQCEQGTLRVITGFSKAKLSGLLKELEDRKVIHKEKRGKKNLVFLREQ